METEAQMLRLGLVLLIVSGGVALIWWLPIWAQRAIVKREEFKVRCLVQKNTPCQFCDGILANHQEGCPDRPDAGPNFMARYDRGWRAARAGKDNPMPDDSSCNIGYCKGARQREFADQRT